MEHLAHDDDTVVSHIHSEIEWIESILIQDGTFRLPGKKVLRPDLVRESSTPQVIAIDLPLIPPTHKFGSEQADFFDVGIVEKFDAKTNGSLVLSECAWVFGIQKRRYIRRPPKFAERLHDAKIG